LLGASSLSNLTEDKLHVRKNSPPVRLVLKSNQLNCIIFWWENMLIKLFI